MTPEFRAFTAQLDKAVPRGLVKAAAIYHGALRRKLQRGYTSGKFTTGNVAASVQMGLPELVDGHWVMTVGTSLMYALYWEMGHMNVFTHKYEREQYWAETVGLNAAKMNAAMGDEMNVVLATGGPAIVDSEAF